MEVLDEHADQILVTPAELAEMFVEHERRGALLALAVAHVEAAGRWADDGSVTMRAWMRNHLRMSDVDAGAMLRRAGLLNRYDAFAERVLASLSEIERRDVRAFDLWFYTSGGWRWLPGIVAVTTLVAWIASAS